MILSGQKTSYYDEYQRKKETNRSLVTPPTLLTDRGAYVNFLEVQLERVSAACLSVQSYDDRFTDIQNLIVALENRCATTTRLTSLAQQCAEEIRTESLTITSKLNQELNNEQKKRSELFESLSGKIHAAENRLHSVSTLESRMLLLETKYHSLEDAKILADAQHLQEIQQMKSRVDNVLTENHHLRNELQHTNTLLSQSIFDSQEQSNKMKNQMDSLVDHFEARLAALQEDYEAKLHSIQCKHNNYIDTLNYSMAQRELELNNLHSKQYGKVGCNLTELNQLVENELKDVKTVLHANEQSNDIIVNTVNALKNEVSEQQTQLFQLEDKFITRLESLLQKYRFPPVIGKDESDMNLPDTFEEKEETERVNQTSNSTSKTNENDTKNESVLMTSELQSLLTTILNTTNANTSALNSLMSAASTPRLHNRSNFDESVMQFNKALQQEQQKSPSHSSRNSFFASPRSFDLLRSRSLSPQRLLASSGGQQVNTSGAVSIDRDKQLSRDSVRAMGLSPARVLRPPPMLESTNMSLFDNSKVELEANSASSSGVRRRSSLKVDVNADSVQPKLSSTEMRDSGVEKRHSSKERSAKSSSGKRSKKSSKSVTSMSLDDSAVVNDIAKTLSFSFTSPSRLRPSSNQRLGSGVTSARTSVESLRQSADRLLKSPPRVSGATAALFSRQEQEALRSKGVTFRPTSQDFASGLRKSNDQTSLQIGPAWKPINTYVPPVAFTMFDGPPRTVTSSGGGSGRETCSSTGSNDNSAGDGNGNDTVCVSDTKVCNTECESGDNNKALNISSVTDSTEGYCDHSGNNIVTKIGNTLGKIKSVKRSETEACKMVDISTNTNNSLCDKDSGNLNLERSLISEGKQTLRSIGQNKIEQDVGSSLIIDENISRANVTTKPEKSRSGSNLRSTANRLLGNVDPDAHVAFYRPVSPLSHSRLSKILEQYPLR